MGKTRWTHTQETRLAELITTHSHKEIADELGIEADSVRDRCSLLQLKRPTQKGWTAKELNTLKELRKAGDTLEEIAIKMGRTLPSIQQQLKRKKIRVREYWTKTEIKDLIRMYENGSTEKIMMEWLGKSRQAVSGKLYRLRQKGVIQ
jgi:biotin operon repressor